MTRPVELEDGTEDPRYLEYDGDLCDDDQRCEHGIFIGSSWGPDILCGYCEEGISAEEMERSILLDRRYDERRYLRMFVEAIRVIHKEGEVELPLLIEFQKNVNRLVQVLEEIAEMDEKE
tara:strand:- start:399 stop:758 length:360 start_codon:yes stop_codon:yes gene_type:complete